jgi:DUF4097 and DUF4098 domain-containing protein YvlB
MSSRSDRSRSDEDRDCAEDSRGFGGFIRNLLSGVPWSESARAEETITLDPPEGRHMAIHNANGKTRVLGEDRDDIEIFAEKRARAETVEAADDVLDEIEVTTEEIAGGLEIEVVAPSRWKRHGSAHLVVRTPRDIEVTVVAANGRVVLEGLRSAVHARSSNGPVSISDVVGDVEVFTSNAKVSCSCTCGNLKARSSNSKIQLDEHSGSIDASTSNGVIHVALSRIGSDGIVLATSNGKILLELPEGVDGDLDVRVDNGLIRNGLEIDQAPGDERTGRLRGRLGRGGIPIKLRTSNGTVSLR